ncbi:MAG: hypothetical protein J5714_01640 [Alphaproteobacteria bacterium]|nr:hypothetical protein [Alphaproteobacteria bacterium]
MKRLAIFVGGLLVLPAFAEVAPVFITDEGALEYADAMYDENGFLIIPETEIVEETAETAASETPTSVKISRAPVNATPVANRTTASRAVPATSGTKSSGRGTAAGNSSRVVAARTTTSARTDASRAVASRGTTNASPRATGTTTATRTATTTAATRAAAARTTGGSSRAATTSGTTVARTATTAGRTTAARTATAAGTARATTTGAGRISVRGDVAAKGATITASNGMVTTLESSNTPLYKSASTRRTPTVRMSSVSGVSADTTSVSMSLEDMDDLAELTDYCKAQYASCMDNYCNVLDDNQGRCSCSANLKNYAKAEAALKTATEELQDVAQKIQYIGLTSREVETLFTETAAEEKMRTNGTDNSQLQANLNKIKDMIINVSSGGATSTADNGILNFDLSGLLEFSFDSTGFDLASLFGTTNTNSVSNQRGEQLYKTAAARCKTSVLKACTARGVDASLITNAYDLEIDRECMAYERSLNDSNDQMLATVRNAKNVLQKARLMVAQQKNAYDMRGCINALDECMQDEFVCGSDYENCLDPTGRYIVNGEIVVGSQPGHAIDPEARDLVSSVMTSDVCRVNLYRTWDMPGATCQIHADPQGSSNYTTYLKNPTYNQNNAWGSGTNDTLSEYITQTVKSNSAEKVSENMSKYLQNKIGYVNKDGRAYGMCVSVLNKCQDYSYDGKGTSAKYKQDNDVIKQYLARVLIQIKAKQDEILANYAESCVSDVTTCLTQNGYPTEDPIDWETDEYSTNTTKMNIAVNACRAQVVTCMSVNGYSIDTPTPTEMNCWVQGLLYSTSTDDCMRDNIYGNTCDDDEFFCQYTGECLKDGDSCEPQEYTVLIDCNGGAPTNIQSKTTTNKDLYLSGSWCERLGYTLNVWKCGQNNLEFLPNTSYRPSVNNTTCTAEWNKNNPTPPEPEYTVIIKCSQKQPYTFITTAGDLLSMDGCPEGGCGQVSTENGCIYLDVTSSGNQHYCNWSSPYENSPMWQCNGETPPKNGKFCPTENGVVCEVTNRDGTNQDEPFWTEISFDYGNVSNSDLIAANPSRLYVDSNHVCDGVYDRLYGDNGENCPGSAYSYTQLTNVPRTYSNSSIFNGFYNGNTEYIDGNGVFKSALYGIADLSSFAGDAFTITAQWTTPSTGTGGLRYVEIKDQGGTRIPRTRGLSTADAFWVDTDGSICQHPGVYISNPSQNSMVCTEAVDSIGWYMKQNSRASGFYIDVNGESVLFAREDGTVVTENLAKLADTDPDETLTATVKVFTTGGSIGFVYFDDNNHTWNATYTVPDEDYYIYDNFNINFYPNRPTTANSNTPMTLRYAQGTGYTNPNTGARVTNAPSVTDTNYTFRGYYPGAKSAVSVDDSTGLRWPAGSNPLLLNNTSWVLATTDANFNGLNLYAAWAEKCNNVDNGTCTLDINSSGAVDYGITCINGYEPRGTGADVKCVAPGENWNSITLPGAE